MTGGARDTAPPRRYNALSASYDGLMENGRYAARAAFLIGLLRESAIAVHTVLDLACGTGTVAWTLFRHGFRVIASDASEEMLTEALRKGERMRQDADRDGNEDGGMTEDVPPPLFICQPMQRLKLAGPVDGVISTLDSLNYLTRERDIRETFRRVYRYLRPGGRFLFDVNTPYRLRHMDRQTFLDETEDTFCVWRTFFSEKTRVCTWQVDLFRRRPDDTWERAFEEHRERAWEEEQLRRFLTDAGFSRVRVTGDLSRRPPKETEVRWTVLAEKEQL